MKTLAYVLFLSLGAGCVTDTSEDGPIITQGGLPTANTPQVPTTIEARLCRAEDLRDLSVCSTTVDSGGLTVTLGDNAAVTEPDGSFRIDVPIGLTNQLDPTFSVTGPGVVPTTFPITLPFTNAGAVPIVDADLYARMLSSNGVALEPGTGSILATVRDDVGPLSGVTVTSTPTSSFGPFFDLDGATSTSWGLDGTGMRGAVWIPGLTAGMVDLSYSHIAGGLSTNVGGVSVRNGGVTIIDTTFTTP